MTAGATARKLLVMDVDSTLITGEVIDMLAAHAGTGTLVAAITEAAMRGEIDFTESLQRRVAALAGLSVDVFPLVLNQVVLSPGAPELIEETRRRGWDIALVSGGFVEVVGPLAARLGIQRYRANRLAVHHGRLTGATIGPIIDRAAKAEALREFAAQCKVPLHDTIAIGDGANDLDMLSAAGTAVAYRAKPAVKKHVRYTIEGRLDELWQFIELN